MPVSRWKSHVEPVKLLFYFIFHGMQIGLFVVGWYGNPKDHATKHGTGSNGHTANSPDRYKQVTDARLAPLNQLTFSVWISRGAGLVLSVDCTLILLPMCRTLLRYIRPKIRWLPLDESQWFHRQVAYSILFWSLVHTFAHYVK